MNSRHMVSKGTECGGTRPGGHRSAAFLDIEASALVEGYPIEVAWCSDDLLSAQSILIKPTKEWWTWRRWDEDAERVHGLTPARLDAEGRPADQVAWSLLGRLMGKRAVLSDCPRGDQQWLDLLLETAGMTAGEITLVDADVDTARNRVDRWHGSDGAQALLDAVSRTSAVAGLAAHRALDDAIGHAMTAAMAAGRFEENDLVARARRLLAEHERR